MMISSLNKAGLGYSICSCQEILFLFWQTEKIQPIINYWSASWTRLARDILQEPTAVGREPDIFTSFNETSNNFKSQIMVDINCKRTSNNWQLNVKSSNKATNQQSNLVKTVGASSRPQPKLQLSKPAWKSFFGNYCNRNHIWSIIITWA